MDYRVKITIRNNRILNRMEEKGYPSMTSFSKAFDVSQDQIQAVISGRIKLITKKTNTDKSSTWISFAPN